MDLNLNLYPPPLSLDLSYDLALDSLSLPFSSSNIDDILMQVPFIEALDSFDGNFFEAFDLPSYNNTPHIPHEDRRINELNSIPYSATPMFDNDPLARTGGPVPLFRRVFEMPQMRANQDESDPTANSPTDPERLMHDIRRSGRSLGKHKCKEKAQKTESSGEEKKEKTNNGASDFDCNICFDVAKEPVVTCCGHLFCWPCLYQWIHVHCDFNECPVCKGKVNESSIVPIYGRGSGENKRNDDNNVEDENQSLKIPPRPTGNRVESIRQQLHSPLFRRPEAWIQEVQELFSELPERLRLLRRDDIRNPNSNPIPQNETLIPSVNGTSLHRGSTRAREANLSVVSEDSREIDPSPSQASTSSTMAVILGDSDGLNRGGRSPMVLRSRVRSRNLSESSDLSGRPTQLQQRRRRN